MEVETIMMIDTMITGIEMIGKVEGIKERQGFTKNMSFKACSYSIEIRFYWLNRLFRA